jgi:hypothetical protein
MATANRAFHLGNVGRGGENEIYVTVPEPLFRKDRVRARVAIAGGGTVVIHIEAYELRQVAEFLQSVAASMDEIDAERKAKEQQP